MHRNEILHRDLKPSNILIDFNNHVKIADLGLAAKLVKKNPEMSTVLASSAPLKGAGTQLYWTRENFQLIFKKQSEVYIAGLIIAFTITKENPYSDMNDENAKYESIK